MRVVCATALLFSLSPVFADTGPAVEWTQSADRLSNGSPNWHSEELRLSTPIAPRQALDGSLRRSSRFGFSDNQVEVNYTLPLTRRLGATLSASGSDTHRFLPKSDVGASLQYELARAWFIHGGASGTEYDTVSVRKAVLGLEHYVSAWRWFAAWRPTRAGDVTAHGGDLRVDYYYGDTDFVGLQAAAGKEAANIDGRNVILSTVRSAALTGRHSLSRDWSLRYGVERVKQGEFYNRTGIRLGAQYAF